jgi:ribosome-associated protein
MKKKAADKKPFAQKAGMKAFAGKKVVGKKAGAKKQIARPTANYKAAASAKKLAKKIAKSFKKPAAKKVKYAHSEPKLDGLPEQMRKVALQVLDERQAEDIVDVDMTGRSSVADYLIVASGRAQRQLSALAHYLREAFAKLGVQKVRVEGLPEANWVLVDAGDVVIHLFRPEVRRYYDIEKIWLDKADRP